MEKLTRIESPRFLLVDDNPMFADLMAKVARDQGFHVEVTSNAADFQAAYLRDKPALLGVDLVMPETDGIELLSWLCDTGSTVPTMVFSGKQAVYLKAAKALVEAYGDFEIQTFGKPLDLTDLQATLKHFQERRQQGNAGPAIGAFLRRSPRT